MEGTEFQFFSPEIYQVNLLDQRLDLFCHGIELAGKKADLIVPIYPDPSGELLILQKLHVFCNIFQGPAHLP